MMATYAVNLRVPMFLFGLVVGSFLNVVGYRVPRRESILSPRSHCTACSHTLQWYELIPIFSWLLLRGRCKSCRTPISVRYPILELVTASLFSATTLYVQDFAHVVAWCVFWTLMISVTATDLTSMRVPNVLSLPGALVTMGIVVLTGTQTWSASLLGAGGGFLVMLFLNLISRGKMGMGDVKLFLSIGAIFGPYGAVETLVFASAAGSLVGLAMRFTGLLPPRTYIPFVPYILVGTILTEFFGPRLASWYISAILHLV